MAIEKRNHSNNHSNARGSSLAATCDSTKAAILYSQDTYVCKEMINKFELSIKISIKITGFR